MTDNSSARVDVHFGPRGIEAWFRMPGGSWQFVRDPISHRAVIYSTTEAAKDAGWAIVMRFMCPPIVAERAHGEAAPAVRSPSDPLDIAGWRAGKERQRVEDRRVFRGLGKGFVVVETKGRARA